MAKLSQLVVIVLLCWGGARDDLSAQPSAPLAFAADTSHTHVGFGVRHLGLSTVSGRFARAAITLHFDTLTVANSRVEAIIESASVSTGNSTRDEDLRSERYLDVVKHPEIRFVSQRVEALADRKLRILGALTIRGITRDAVLDVDILNVLVARNPQQAGLVLAGFRAQTRISRKAFGLTFNRLVEGIAVVDDEVQITIEVEARHQGARKAG